MRTLAVAVLLWSVAAGAHSVQRQAEIASGLQAMLDGTGVHVLARPERGEGLLKFAERLCGDRGRAREIAAANDASGRLAAGRQYRVGFDCLRESLQAEVLEALFPEDHASARGWHHRVTMGADGARSELWTIATWFTGSGRNYRALRELNQLEDETVPPGGVVIIPTNLLLSPFRARVELIAALPPTEVLEYGVDEQGSFASYRLQAGEALYSAVVMRFTGRLFAADVNPLAEEIAVRSGIVDVTDIPVGYRVKIPLEALSPEFLPPDHPGRVEYEQSLEASARFSNRVEAWGLEGVTVILDAGHGGRDVGASTSGVWESLYVYDIMLRTRRILQQRTAAEVVTTTRDSAGYTIEPRDVLSHSQGHAVLTDPPYPIELGRVGTNLRWYLANYILDEERKQRVDPERVVFLSIHADSLHASVRGAMVYVPGLLPIPESYGKTESVYTSRREVKARPRVTFSRSEREKSEGLSRELAGHIIDGFRRANLAIHPNKPVRDRIIRGRGRPWVPAVLRYNAVPAKVLIEVCNLANERDRRLIQTQQFREQIAESIVDGVLSYYGEKRIGGDRVAAR